MILASPQSQDEFDQLSALLAGLQTKWDHVAIAGYRSEENNKEWVSAGERINYQIKWSDGEPNNANGNEHCIGEDTWQI